jgi:hypothetical protein
MKKMKVDLDTSMTSSKKSASRIETAINAVGNVNMKACKGEGCCCVPKKKERKMFNLECEV